MSEGPPAAPAVPAQDQDEGTSQPTSDDAVPLTAAEEWILKDVRAHFLAHIHQEHPKFKQDVEDGKYPRWSLLDKPELAEKFQCTEDELEKAHKDMKKRFFKIRKKDVDHNRTLKSDITWACSLWDMKTVGDVHRRLTSMTEELAALKEAKADTLAVAELHKQMMADQGRMAAEYKAKVEAAVEAKVQPEIERQMEEKKVILESKIAHHEKMAEWAIEGQAKNKAKQAAWEDAHQGELDRQKRKLEDRDRELKRLRQVVAGYEAQQRHQKKRKQDAENQRQRRRLHAQHPAVSTMTPESTTKKTKPRTSRRSALARIGNNAAIV